MKNLICILAILYFIPLGNVKAQKAADEKLNFYVQGRMIEGKPFIKIVPSNQRLWFYGMKNGYKVSISRFQNDSYSDYEVIESELKPAAESDFTNPELPQKYAEPMRKIIYEETFAPEGNSFDDMASADQGMGQFYFTYLLMSAYDPGLSEMSGLQMALPANLPDRFKIKVEVNNAGAKQEQKMLKNLFYTDLASPNFELKQGDKEVTIQWEHSPYQLQFVAYTIERSDDGKAYKPIGSPLVFNGNSPSGKLGFIATTDSLPKNYTNYWYQVRGFDAFGVLSKPGDALRIYGKDMTPPMAPQRVQVDQITPKVISISWTQAPAVDLKGFQVIASPTETGTYQRLHEELLPTSQTSFTYTFKDEPYLYYRVLAVDTAQNAAASTLGYLIVYDTIPPAIPLNILATADSNNVVTLHWNPSPDRDTQGYRVLKAYNPSNGFVSITPIPVADTLFTDTIAKNRLEKKVYYKVVSMDTHYNHSKPSQRVPAAIIDQIPPTSPLLTEAINSEGEAVHLKWIPSSSDDVMSYTVLRSITNDSSYAVVETISADQTKFSDKATAGLYAEYAEYYITATDSSGNSSERSNGKRILFDKDRKNIVISIQSANKQENIILLKWEYPVNDSQSILVYRAENDSPFELIDRVENATSYSDQKVYAGKSYTYKIGVLASSGYRSPLSEEVHIKFK